MKRKIQRWVGSRACNWQKQHFEWCTLSKKFPCWLFIKKLAKPFQDWQREGNVLQQSRLTGQLLQLRAHHFSLLSLFLSPLWLALCITSSQSLPYCIWFPMFHPVDFISLMKPRVFVLRYSHGPHCQRAWRPEHLNGALQIPLAASEPPEMKIDFKSFRLGHWCCVSIMQIPSNGFWKHLSHMKEKLCEPFQTEMSFVLWRLGT